jgi:D-threo-aldose 1-dehydrogenase
MAEDEWPRVVPAAWDNGVRYFDVAPHYGLGLAEERLGAGLADYPRDDYVISTKVGRLLVPNPEYHGQPDDDLFVVAATTRRELDYSRDGVLRSVEDSLRRLRLDRIDILFVHDPIGHEREALDGAFPALEQLRSEGVISSYGAGMNESAMLARFVRNTDLDIVMVAGRYTLLDQSAADELLPLAAERHVSVAAAGVFNSGILAHDDPPDTVPFDYGAAPASVLATARRAARIARSHGVSLPEVAAQFPLTHAAVATVVLGSASAEQAERNARLTERPVPEAVWAELRDAGIIPAAAAA